MKRPAPGHTVEMLPRCTTRGGVALISGDLDISTIRLLESWLPPAADVEVVDLHGVTFFGAAALRSLLIARRSCPHLRIVRPSRAVMRVLTVTGTAAQLSAPDT